MNLFFVSSPFQLMCAMEAVRYFKCTNNLLVLREQENDLAEEHVKHIIRAEDWDKVIRLPKKPKAFSLPRLPDLLRKIKKIKPDMNFDKVFFAEYSTWRIAVILANISANSEIMFDDGTLTLFEFENKISDKKIVNVSRPKKEITLKLLGYKSSRLIQPHSNFEMFTMFNIGSEDIKIHKNKFDLLKEVRELKQVHSKSGDIVFIGDGCTETKLNLNEYALTLKQLCMDNPDKKIQYFPHRNEPVFVRDMLSEIDGLAYVTTQMPIEIQVQQLVNGVSAIYGFYSSALYSLSIIYDGIPIYTRKLVRSEIKDEIGDDFLLSESIGFAEKYLTGDNIYNWARN